MKIKSIKKYPCYEVEIETSDSIEKSESIIIHVSIEENGRVSPMDEGDYIVMKEFGFENFEAELQEHLNNLH